MKAMADELVKRLRIGWHDDDTPIWVSDAMTESADRIEQLVATNEKLTEQRDEARRDAVEAEAYATEVEAEHDKYESAWMTAEGKLADVEAERDRLRKELENIVADCEADYPPSHMAIKYTALWVLKGE